jgi:hypothetical protein
VVHQVRVKGQILRICQTCEYVHRVKTCGISCPEGGQIKQ